MGAKQTKENVLRLIFSLTIKHRKTIYFFFFYKLQTIYWNSKTKILDSINQVNHSNSFHLNSNNGNTKD